jgi:hypothetical protein
MISANFDQQVGLFVHENSDAPQRTPQILNPSKRTCRPHQYAVI